MQNSTCTVFILEGGTNMNKQIDITGVTMTTHRLVLRPWKESDLEDFYAYASVDGVGQMAGWTPHKDQNESSRILNHFIEGKHCFALEYEGHAIGSLGIEEYNETLFPQLDTLQGREIGYVLSKSHWGKGLMTEAVKAVIEYLFTDVKLDFITAGHFTHNKRSQRVIEKCGFRYVTTAPYETRFNTIEESMEYILTKQEWRKAQC